MSSLGFGEVATPTAAPRRPPEITVAIHAGRYTANFEGAFVVFFIGMRINASWRINEWVPVMTAAGQYRELGAKSKLRDRVGRTDAH